jgi:hypothetical protein
MIYFYIWLVVLLGIVLAVPIVSFIEKSRLKKERVEQPSAAAAEADAVAFDDSPAEEMPAEPSLDEFGAETPAGGDDFSAFEDFK